MALPLDLGDIVVAVGGLGTAAFALVDATKVGSKGGLSDKGFECIRSLVETLLGEKVKQTHKVAVYSVLDQLHANWINGVDLAEQRKSAKAALKLELNTSTVGTFASVTKADAQTMTAIVQKLRTGEALSTAETAEFGRFDFVLGTMVDAAYRRADQKYRNKAQVYAGGVAIVLAALGGWSISTLPGFGFFVSGDFPKALLCGVLAVPLAPIAHNVASAIAAGKNVAQAMRGKP